MQQLRRLNAADSLRRDLRFHYGNPDAQQPDVHHLDSSISPLAHFLLSLLYPVLVLALQRPYHSTAIPFAVALCARFVHVPLVVSAVARAFPFPPHAHAAQPRVS